LKKTMQVVLYSSDDDECGSVMIPQGRRKLESAALFGSDGDEPKVVQPVSRVMSLTDSDDDDSSSAGELPMNGGAVGHEAARTRALRLDLFSSDDEAVSSPRTGGANLGSERPLFSSDDDGESVSGQPCERKMSFIAGHQIRSAASAGGMVNSVSCTSTGSTSIRKRKPLFANSDDDEEDEWLK
jgi:hypothetical protein